MLSINIERVGANSILIMTRFIKFQFPIISLVIFCNYSLLFLSLKYRLDIKGI